MNRFREIKKQLPNRFNLAQKVADRLNKKGIKTRYGKRYQYRNIMKTNDDNVINEASIILFEYKAKKMEVDILSKTALNA